MGNDARARRLTDARARHFVTRDARATRIAMGVPSAEDVEFGEEKKIIPLDEDDIALLKTYGLGAYNDPIKDLENDLKTISKRVNDLCGIKGVRHRVSAAVAVGSHGG